MTTPFVPMIHQRVFMSTSRKVSGVNETPVVGRRKGFPVKLHGDHWKCLLITYMVMRYEGKTTPELDVLVKDLQDKVSLNGGIKTYRLRAADIEPMVLLLRTAGGLPFASAYTLLRRAEALAKIDVNDLLADAAR